MPSFSAISRPTHLGKDADQSIVAHVVSVLQCPQGCTCTAAHTQRPNDIIIWTAGLVSNGAECNRPVTGRRAGKQAVKTNPGVPTDAASVRQPLERLLGTGSVGLVRHLPSDAPCRWGRAKRARTQQGGQSIDPCGFQAQQEELLRSKGAGAAAPQHTAAAGTASSIPSTHPCL